MSQLLADAYRLAAEIHADQRTKGDRPSPYIVHLCRVAALSAEETDAPEIIAAAVLHDSVEDTEIRLAAIADRFGPQVAELVGWLTDDPEIEDLPTDQRKARQAEKIAEAPDAAKLIKTADQLDNIAGRLDAFNHWPIERHRLYLAGAQQVVAACRDAAPILAVKFDAAAAALAARIAEAEKEPAS
ncbi:MAG: HD domain-containing protein [Neomegalonema sp.]|nr:HD domain-containing protein [Neomegalonema sp.]